MIKKNIKRLVNCSPYLKRLYYRYRIKSADSVIAETVKNLGQLTKKSQNSEEDSGERVLIVTIPSLPTTVVVDMLVAKGLDSLGAQVCGLAIDACLPADLSTEIGIISPDDLINRGPAFLKEVYSEDQNIEAWRQTGIEFHLLSDLLSTDIHEEADTIADDYSASTVCEFNIDGWPLGEHALAGALRYFARGDLEPGEESEGIVKAYLKAAYMLWKALEKLQNNLRPEVVVCVNGIYVPGGIVNLSAAAFGTRFVCWNVAYRKKCLLFSHGDTYHKTLMNEDPEVWKEAELPVGWQEEIRNYLLSRERGGRDWIVFNQDPNVEDVSALCTRLNIQKPLVVVLTNVVWDAQLHYPANVYSNMVEWILGTIELMWDRDDLDVAIRIHPAETSGDIPSRQRVEDSIRQRFGKLPTHIRVIGPEDNTSTYVLCAAADTVIIYGTKTGLELVARGTPVVVCGEAWIRNKGLTTDVTTQQMYAETLAALPCSEKLPQEQRELGERYAYHFFFRRMIEVSSLKPTGTEPQLQASVDDYSSFPKNDLGLMTICKGILYGDPFVYAPESEK